MTLELPLPGIGIGTIALVVGIVIWYLAFSMRSHEAHREDVAAKRMADQPWDGAGERANR